MRIGLLKGSEIFLANANFFLQDTITNKGGDHAA